MFLDTYIIFQGLFVPKLFNEVFLVYNMYHFLWPKIFFGGQSYK